MKGRLEQAWETAYLGNCTFGKLPLGKMPLGKLSFGKMPLEKMPLEKYLTSILLQDEGRMMRRKYLEKSGPNKMELLEKW